MAVGTWESQFQLRPFWANSTSLGLSGSPVSDRHISATPEREGQHRGSGLETMAKEQHWALVVYGKGHGIDH
jgi:hypothetical protein